MEDKSVEQYLADLENGIKSFDAKFEPVTAQYKTLQERLDTLETKLNTPEAGHESVKDVESEWSKSYCTYLMSGKGYDQDAFIAQVKDFEPEKLKTLASDNLTTGGYWMPPTLVDRIVEYILVLDPFRAAAAVETLRVGDTLEMINDVAATLAGWTSERGSRTATANVTFGKISIPTHPMYAMPAITQKMSRMGAFDVEAYMVRKVGEYMAYLEGVAFMTGSGVGQPEGLVTYAKGVAEGTIAPSGVTAAEDSRAIDSGHATQIPDMDCLIAVQDGLMDKYQPNAVWIMARATKSVLRKMTDGMGRYILDENVEKSGMDSLFGKPVLYMNSMNTISSGVTFTQEDIPIIYGDMKQCYQIVDVPGMISIRDDITTKGQIALYTEKLGVGGAVVDPNAYMALEIDT